MLRFVLLGGVTAVLLYALDRLANIFVRPTPRPPDRTIDELERVVWEDLLIPAGNHALAAWFLRPPGPDERGRSSHPPALFVLAHGWGASYGTVLRLAEPLVAAGHEVLVFDVRGHGRNKALPYVTVRDFRDDVAAALRWVKGRFPGRPVVLVGHSMGGAGAALAAADGAPLDGLVLIATPADVMRVTAEYLTDQGLPGWLVVRLFRPFFWRRVGSGFSALTPGRRIADVRVPLLLLQPEHDTRVVREHADRLAEAARQPYILIPGAEHTDVLEHAETLRRVQEFARSVESARP